MKGEILPGSVEEQLLIEYFKRKDEFLIAIATIIAQASITTKEISDEVNKLIGQTRMIFIHGDQTKTTAERRKKLSEQLISKLPLTPKGTIDKSFFRSPKETIDKKQKEFKLEKKVRLKP